MKKIIGMFALICAFTSCDDGDIILESLNFSDVAVQKCTTNNVLYKVTRDELLVLNIPETLFDTTSSTSSNPKVYALKADELMYRKYDGNVNSNSICPLIPPAQPIVLKEWKAAAGGTIEIITTPKTTVDPNTQITTTTGHIHLIHFKNVLFSNSEGSFTYENYIFGERVIDL